MKLKRMFSMAWESIRQRKLRSFLTTLGVVIGITAIISLASLSEGFRISITERMEQGFELDVLTVIPGSFFAGGIEKFTDTEVARVKGVPNASFATPVVRAPLSAILYNGDKNVTALVVAGIDFTEFVDKVFPDRFHFEEGKMPEQIKNNTLIIGYKVNHPNETEPDPFAHFNDTVTMPVVVSIDPFPIFENYTFNVAGTLEKTGTAGLTSFDYWIFMPLETARKIYGNATDLIFVKVPDPELSENVAEEIEALFAPYRLTVLVPLSFIQQVNSILNMVEIFLTSIASIALLVAGIGIMNIMTVSVMERTREIGILKALGAKSRTILTMFLTEATLIGVVGSLIGVPTGYGISHVLSYILSSFVSPQQNRVFRAPETESAAITPIFSWPWVMIAVIFGISICILFGLYPARKAARLDPVEALRYE